MYNDDWNKGEVAAISGYLNNIIYYLINLSENNLELEGNIQLRVAGLNTIYESYQDSSIL